MTILKTVTYESKLLDFQNAPALFLKFYYWAHPKTGGFLAETKYLNIAIDMGCTCVADGVFLPFITNQTRRF